MRNRCLAVASALGVVAGMALIPVIVAGEGSASPKTPMGEPDLQGRWYAFETRRQRPAEYAGRELLTDVESPLAPASRGSNRSLKGSMIRRREEVGTSAPR